MKFDRKNVLIAIGVLGVVLQLPFLFRADVTLFILYVLPYIAVLIANRYFGILSGLLLGTFGMLAIDAIVLVELTLDIQEPWSLIFSLLSTFKFFIIFPVFALLEIFCDKTR